MSIFRILFGANLLIVAFALWQCVVLSTSQLISQSSDGTRTVVAEAPGNTWFVTSPLLFLLVVTVVVLGGAAMLHARGRRGMATLLLLIPAVPVVLGGIVMVGLMVLFTIGTPSR
jgi:uncharacterized membrane protein YhaH (DUF805 family)